MDNNKLEDWLSDDDFFENKDLLNKVAGEKEPEERRASRILHFFKLIRVFPLPVDEKDRLRHKIESSIAGRQKERVWFKWAAAAILVLGLAGSVWFFSEKPTPVMMNYAESLEIPKGDNNTLLILGDKKKISIAEDNSNIAYQPDGKNIRIKQNKQVENVKDSVNSGFHAVVVPYGKRSEIVLSDGTKVWLNSGTKLVFPASFKSDKREVFLQGEAIFEVTHHENSGFFVRTNDFSVKVLGTVFNVTAYADDMSSSAVLERGHIEIIREKGIFSAKALDMTPGTMAVFDPQQKSFASYAVDPQDYLSWRDGFLTLHSEKMINILRKLSRYYNVDIVLNDKSLESETFTGGLDLKNSPLEIFEVISRMVPLRAQEENGRITINSR